MITDIILVGLNALVVAGGHALAALILWPFLRSA